MKLVPNIGKSKITVCVRDYTEVKGLGFDKFTSISNGRETFINTICTFDIETTSVRETECSVFGQDFAFMYVWQFCINGIVYMGRTWAEFQKLLQNILNEIKCPGDLVIYVHNLPFEFQFFRNFFKIKEVFAMEKRQVVKCKIEGAEFRCSYKLSNMSLDRFLKQGKNVNAFKMSGTDFDYSTERFPDTELTLAEMGYCICDVLGLWERLVDYMDEYTLISIPMTSTGFVREDFRNIMKQNPKNRQKLKECALDEETYCACYEAVRGGIAGSNHINTGYILEEVDSEDIKSSYPYQMLTNYFPASKFTTYGVKYDSSDFRWLINNMCCLMLWEGRNFKTKKFESIPYISKDKCRAIQGGKFGNGKVFSADRIGMLCTEVDFKIIETHYDFDSIVIRKMWCAQRDMLSYEFRCRLQEMFQAKTDLEEGDPYLYMKYKNKINGSFGMMLTNILNDTISYSNKSGDPWTAEPVEDYSIALMKYYNNKNSFLSYQHGVWVTAHARAALMEGIDIVGNDLVAVDTDSVKHINDHIDGFKIINKRIIDKAEEYDIKPYAIKNGHKHYLGVWEHEGQEGKKTYHKFITLGAKKYASEDETGNVTITVSGLSKKTGAEYIKNRGGIEKAFKPGLIVPEEYSGRLEAKYCDVDTPRILFYKGHEICLGSSVGLFPVTYTLGITDEWNEIINGMADEYYM